jgi:hypothetical protein
MPISLLGYLLVIGAAYTLKTVPAIEAEQANAKGVPHD